MVRTEHVSSPTDHGQGYSGITLCSQKYAPFGQMPSSLFNSQIIFLSCKCRVSRSSDDAFS